MRSSNQRLSMNSQSEISTMIKVKTYDLIKYLSFYILNLNEDGYFMATTGVYRSEILNDPRRNKKG